MLIKKIQHLLFAATIAGFVLVQLHSPAISSIHPRYTSGRGSVSLQDIQAADPGQSARGVIEEEIPNVRLVLNVMPPCKSDPSQITFRYPYEKKNIDTLQCNGQTFPIYKVLQKQN
jgi:hypothetical protein